ncbi:MAG: hypothetical protein MOB07_31445 [Acidobacteria bacterium]|nr:hypothetical protein [Acidobacteriota bacterium]
MKKRGCGFRVEGGIYLTVATSEFGSPIDDFLRDPPEIVDLDQLQVPKRHPVALPRTNGNGQEVYHVYDYVGAEHYPDLASFIEEAREMGISRRCELPDYSVLTPASKLVLIHPRAWIEPYAAYYDAMSGEETDTWKCPKRLSGASRAEDLRLHAFHERAMCARLWWHDIEPLKNDSKGHRDMRIVGLPCGSVYYGFNIPDEIEPEYSTAIFGVFPLGHLEVVRDKMDGAHEKKLKKLKLEAQLPFDEVEE